MHLTQIAEEVTKGIIQGKITTANPTVLVLAGLQYSGKSYLANLITEKNFAHFWATNIKKKYNIKNPEMIEVAKLVIQSATTQGFNVVIDFVNHKYETRKKFQDEAEQLNVAYKVIFIDTPKVIRLQRREENITIGDQPGRRIISLEQMDEFERDFDLPRDDERVTSLSSQDDINCFLESL